MINKLSLAQKPTPLQPLTRLGGILGIDLWIKRDDLTGDILTGGNKIRKLEYVLAEAVAQGADTVIVSGGLQSNLVKTTAALAVKQGLKPVLVLLGKKPELKKGNLFLDTLLNVACRFVEGSHPSSLNDEVLRIKAELEAGGKGVYVIPLGASNGLGALGYVDAYGEMKEQANAFNLSFDWEFVSAGSGGTLAGIYIGHGICDDQSQLVGVSPWLPAAEVKERINKCVEEAACYRNIKGQKDEPLITENFIGDGYGIPTKGCIEAIRLMAQNEGILLDQTYTGKAMAGLINHVRTGVIRPGQKVLFWHTGGAPALSLLEEHWEALNK